MANLFQSIPLRPPRRNFFNLSHERKQTTEMMRLTPVMCEKVLGSDRFSVTSDILVRMMATVAPIMHNINIYTHFFFVPRRLLWSDWQDYIGGGRDGQYNVPRPTLPLDKLISYFKDVLKWSDKDIAACFGIGSTMDYFGFPVHKWTTSSGLINYDIIHDGSPSFNSKIADFPIPLEPFMANFKIYCDYYRDETLSPYKEWQDYVDLNFTSPVFWSDLSSKTVNNWPTIQDFKLFLYSIFRVQNRAWAKDIFTSALPWQQRGPVVSVPVNVPTYGLGSDLQAEINIGEMLGQGQLRPQGTQSGAVSVSRSSGNSNYVVSGDVVNPRWQPNSASSSMYNAPVTNAGSAVALTGELLLQELRYTMKVQEFFEKDARGGYRYSEVLLSHFGVRPQDSRLQRAEYLGGGRSPLIISQVANTSSGDSGNPQANLAGLGFSRQKTHQFNYYVPEHGWIIGYMSIMPKANYMDGVPRQYYGLSRFDEYWPSFAHLGEQPIQNMELSILAGYSEINDSSSPFGYTPRYAEYKTRQDSVHGAFRTTLKYWHLAREFDTVPTLSEEFIDSPPNSDRIFATSTDIPANTDHFLCQIYNRVKAIRPMPKWGVPKF